MRKPTGLLPHLFVGGLLLLSAGAIVLSLASAPPVASQQLQEAAKNTDTASSFVLTDRNTIKSTTATPALGGRSSQSDVVRIVYQSPDRVLDEVTSAPGHTVTLLVVGDRRFERSDDGLWSLLPPTAQSVTSDGAAAASEVLLPLRSLEGATSVVSRGATYSFVPAEESSLLENLFGPTAEEISSVRFSAHLSGEFVSSENVVALQGPAVYALDFAFSSVDSAPSVVVPAPSRVVGGG